MATENTVGGDSNRTIGHSDEVYLVAAPVEFVRRAEWRDVKYIAHIAKEYEGEENWSWTPKVVAESLEFFFVEGQPVNGFVRAQPLGDDLLLTFIAVHRDARKRGVATRLLEAMEAVARASGLDGVINFGPKTPGITSIYKKLGYKEIGISPVAWGFGSNPIFYKEVNNVEHSETPTI